MTRALVDMIYSWPKVNIEIFVKKNNKRLLIYSGKEIKKIFNDFEIQHHEVREFIFQSLNKELNLAGINLEFGM